MEHRDTKELITLKYIPLSNEIKIKKAQGDKITKKLLGDGIYKTQNRNILINYNGDRVKTNQGEDIIMEQYKIFVSDGTTSYEVPGKKPIDDSIVEFEKTGQTQRTQTNPKRRKRHHQHIRRTKTFKKGLRHISL